MPLEKRFSKLDTICKGFYLDNIFRSLDGWSKSMSIEKVKEAIKGILIALSRALRCMCGPGSGYGH